MGEPLGHPSASVRASTLRPSAFAAMVESRFAFPAGLCGVILGRAWLGGAVNLTREVQTANKRKSSLRVRDLGYFEIFGIKGERLEQSVQRRVSEHRSRDLPFLSPSSSELGLLSPSPRAELIRVATSLPSRAQIYTMLLE